MRLVLGAWSCAAALALVGTAVAADRAPSARPAVTVYSHDLGFVRETRAVTLAHARDTLRLAVPAALDFSSARLEVAGAGVERLAFHDEVANGDLALDRARGARVRLTLRGDRVVEGVLVAVDPSWLLVRADDGTLHDVARTALDDARVPAAGRDRLRPELEAVVAGRPGPLEARISYLTGGLSWSAEHVVVRRGENAAQWSTRVVVANNTGRDYEDADLKLVAGDINQQGGAPPPRPMFEAMAAAPRVLQKADLSEESFADYHLYTLDHPATLRDREQQSLLMLEPREIKVRPRYLFRNGDPRGVTTQLQVVNDHAAGLGVPLPAGRVRFYQQDASGALQFTGETRINHTAERETLTLDIGTAFDLVAERRTSYDKRISDREREYGVEITLRNHKPSAVEIVVEENAGGDIEIVQKSHEFVRVDANTLRFTIAVPAGRDAVLRYVARQRW